MNVVLATYGALAKIAFSPAMSASVASVLSTMLKPMFSLSSRLIVRADKPRNAVTPINISTNATLTVAVMFDWK